MSVRCKVIEKAFFDDHRVYPGDEVVLTDRQAAKLGAASPFRKIVGGTGDTKLAPTKKTKKKKTSAAIAE